jgi:CRP/FNR family cyclic AMP-dependent transcriptional regulator
LVREAVPETMHPADSHVQWGAMSDPKSSRAAALKKVPLFADLSEKELGFLADHAVPRRFKAGDLVFSEGEPCEGLFVVESGAIKVFTTSAGGREQVLTIEGAGGSVAELPVFDGGAYPASAAAMSNASLLFVSKRDFQALCVEHPEVALKVLKVVGSRLRRLVGIIEELSFTTVRHRLASLLFSLAKRRGTKTDRGIEIALKSSNQELAAHIGTVRELVSRNLSRFQTEGLIKLEGKTIIIPDLEKLRREVEAPE